MNTKESLKDEVGSKWNKVVISLVSILFVYIILSAIFSFWPFSIARSIVQKTLSGEAIMYNYEWFYDQYNVIEATKAKVEIAKQAMVAADGTNLYEVKVTEYNGVRMVLQSMIAEYNSKSSQKTRNLWKAEGLPYKIELGE